MSNGIDLAAFDRPTIVEVWAPSCSECRTMQPDLDATAAKFADDVDTVKINAAQETEAVRQWKVMGTPIVIGISGGDEVFRFSGRRSRSEIEDAFNAVSSGGAVGKVGRQDVALRVGAGVAPWPKARSADEDLKECPCAAGTPANTCQSISTARSRQLRRTS